MTALAPQASRPLSNQGRSSLEPPATHQTASPEGGQAGVQSGAADHAEVHEAVRWLEQDAAYLKNQARIKRASGELAADWVADLIEKNAEHSAQMARDLLASIGTSEVTHA